jgi:hypothetical protein
MDCKCFELNGLDTLIQLAQQRDDEGPGVLVHWRNPHFGDSKIAWVELDDILDQKLTMLYGWTLSTQPHPSSCDGFLGNQDVCQCNFADGIHALDCPISRPLTNQCTCNEEWHLSSHVNDLPVLNVNGLFTPTLNNSNHSQNDSSSPPFQAFDCIVTLDVHDLLLGRRP